MIGFDDPATVARYADNPPRVVPGFHDLQRMTRLLLAETAPVDGQILVVGAGGGLELRAFAEAQPLWRFVGVDPSAEMLKLARLTLGSLGERAELHQGYIATAPEGPFDAASCLLTLHFVPEAARVATLAEIRRRLRPGAAFVVAHHRATCETAGWTVSQPSVPKKAQRSMPHGAAHEPSADSCRSCLQRPNSYTS